MDERKSIISLPHADPSRWQFSRGYRKFDKDAWNENSTGLLQRPCQITVHDYGVDADNKKLYFINGRNHAVSEPSPNVSSVAHLLSVFPPGFLEARPAWASVRWIDIDGMNGEVVQFLLGVMGCERQYTFNTIVDLRQRALGLLLDSEDADAADVLKFLLVTKVASLSSAAATAIAREDADPAAGKQLYNLRAAGEDQERSAIDYEQISYLLRLDSETVGTLVSFQEGKSGDVFGEVRDHLRSPSGRLHLREAPYLLLQLLRASTESAVNIANFLSAALDQLQGALDAAPESIELVTHARHIDAECDVLHRTMLPFGGALHQLTARVFPEQLMGRSRSAWGSVGVQLKRLTENVGAERARAVALVDEYKDRQEKRQEEAQARIETSQNIMSLVLAIFSPLAFVSGLYGMNFVKSDGSPGIPELTWGFRPSDPADPTSKSEWDGSITGYGYFWILSGAIIVLTVAGYMYLGLIYTPLELYRVLAHGSAEAPTIAAAENTLPSEAALKREQLELEARQQAAEERQRQEESEADDAAVAVVQSPLTPGVDGDEVSNV